MLYHRRRGLTQHIISLFGRPAFRSVLWICVLYPCFCILKLLAFIFIFYPRKRGLTSHSTYNQPLWQESIPFSLVNSCLLSLLLGLVSLCIFNLSSCNSNVIPGKEVSHLTQHIISLFGRPAFRSVLSCYINQYPLSLLLILVSLYIFNLSSCNSNVIPGEEVLYHRRRGLTQHIISLFGRPAFHSVLCLLLYDSIKHLFSCMITINKWDQWIKHLS